ANLLGNIMTDSTTILLCMEDSLRALHDAAMAFQAPDAEYIFDRLRAEGVAEDALERAFEFYGPDILEIDAFTAKMKDAGSLYIGRPGVDDISAAFPPLPVIKAVAQAGLAGYNGNPQIAHVYVDGVLA